MDYIIDIASLRKSKNIKQSEMAELLGVNQSQISEIERGIRPVSSKYEDILVAQFGKNICDKFRVSSQDNRRITIKGDVKGNGSVHQDNNCTSIDLNDKDLQIRLNECCTELAKVKKELEKANNRIDKLLSIIENLSKE
ncbi:helix-turn-helix domain-containing protein [uncultured Muribaculum sp.]|uniref:helix-turn-helix domain-containing protein n=1 Tax=uncultured Muribaculum sp. TaxID=1918613 RepID=UPI002677125D|nr:helix-turn-helix transcriptional regulator [uncultured Muribaculum sp.]